MMHKYQELIDSGLIKAKQYPEKGLSVLKYTQKVFFNGLWDVSPLLLEARGLVIDNNGNVVMRPFLKCFNYGEGGYGYEVNLSEKVRCVQKLNGFLGIAAMYNGELLVGTTGTLDSEYAELARKLILEALDGKQLCNYLTYCFEICDPSDPHIVAEETGVYLIGCIHTRAGYSLSERDLDYVAGYYKGFKRPYHFTTEMGNALMAAKSVSHEGYIIQHLNGEVICKVKSNHYLSKKALMRMGKNNINLMYDHPEKFKERLDEEFYALFDSIIDYCPKEQWAQCNEQERRSFIEGYFENNKYMGDN